MHVILHRAENPQSRLCDCHNNNYVSKDGGGGQKVCWKGFAAVGYGGVFKHDSCQPEGFPKARAWLISPTHPMGPLKTPSRPFADALPKCFRLQPLEKSHFSNSLRPLHRRATGQGSIVDNRWLCEPVCQYLGPTAIQANQVHPGHHVALPWFTVKAAMTGPFTYLVMPITSTEKKT